MSFIYVIGSSNCEVCKIGFSVDPEKRLKQLQTGHPATLMIHYQEEVPDRHVRLIETAVHTNIRHLRERGEWYRIVPDKAILQVQFAIIDLSLDDA